MAFMGPAFLDIALVGLTLMCALALSTLQQSTG